MEKDLKSALLEIRKIIMAPQWLTYGMTTNLPRQAPKWKPANHRLKSRSDKLESVNEVGANV